MKKNDIFKGEFTLATTDILQFEYEDFEDWWRDNHDDDEPCPKDNSREFWDWCADERDFNWECDIENIETCGKYNVPVVITGALGLWWGHPTIVPEKYNSVKDAIDRIMKDGYDDVDIKFNNGVLEVLGHHHDGTNCFEIHALTRKGVAKFISAENEWRDPAPLKKWDCKRLPYLYAIAE